MIDTSIAYEICYVPNEPTKWGYHLLGRVGRRLDLVSINNRPARFSSSKLAGLALKSIVTQDDQVLSGVVTRRFAGWSGKEASA